MRRVTRHQILVEYFPPVIVFQGTPQSDGPGDWHNELGGTPTWSSVDEQPFVIDSDYAESNLTTAMPSTQEWWLNAVNDPQNNIAHYIVFKSGKSSDDTSGDIVNVIIRLFQYDPTNISRFEICNKTYNNIGARTFLTITLTALEADSIIDYGQLWIKVEAYKG